MSGNEIATQGGGTLALRDDQSQWTPTQRAALAQIGVQNASDADLSVFLHYCQRTRLDPFSRQIYMIWRKDREAPGGGKQTIQTGIDGFRIIAGRTGLYRGRKPIEWCGRDGRWRDVWIPAARDEKPYAARCSVFREGYAEPVTAVVLFEEFAGRKFGGDLTSMWTTKAAWMIGKVAEAAALRAAFPNDLGGLYTDDEMEHVDNPVPGPSMPNTVDGQVAGPDWGALIAEREKVAPEDPRAAWQSLRDLFDQARGMDPNNVAVLEQIAAAAKRVEDIAKARDAEQSKDAPAKGGEPKGGRKQRDPSEPKLASAAQKGTIARRIHAAGAVGRDVRLFIAAEIAGIPHPLTSFDVLTTAQASAIIKWLDEHEAPDEPDALSAALEALVPPDEDPRWEPYGPAEEDGRDSDDLPAEPTTTEEADQ